MDIHKRQLIISIAGSLLIGLLLGWWLSTGSGTESAFHDHEENGKTYTCSMHPQIRQDEPGSCPICGMDLIPLSDLDEGDEGSSPYILKMTPEAVALANISTSTVSGGSGGSTIALSGKIQEDERRVSSITSNFSGRVDRLWVDFTGQEVKKGERLARIYSPELISAHQELIEAVKVKEKQPLIYEAVRNKLKQWQLTDGQIQELEQQNEVKSHYDIYSEASGIVTQRNISVGDYVNRGSVIFEVMDLRKVWVMLDAYENNIASLHKGEKVTFKVQAYPNQEFEAIVSFIDPLVNPQSRTIKVRAEANNPEYLLKPEMFVTAKIQGGQKESKAGVLVPKSAVLWTGKRAVVYVQVGDRDHPAFEMREVDLGPRSGEQYWVGSGLNSGEKVVTNGVFAVDGAAQLSGKYSMMSKPEVQKMDVDEAFIQQLDQVLKSYFGLKNHLVADKAKEASAAASEMKRRLGQVDMKLLEGEAHEKWMVLLNPMDSDLKEMEQARDIAKQRQVFISLSDQLIKAVETFGTLQEEVFKSYCPMADQDEGAYWLSEFEEIKNPYFGKSMLTCGEVKAIFRKGQQAGGSDQNRQQEPSGSTHQH